ncbi:MAG: hypothetical protein Q9220_001974 [cf. Caloplaca sp. 1 TL-2023]
MRIPAFFSTLLTAATTPLSSFTSTYPTVTYDGGTVIDAIPRPTITHRDEMISFPHVTIVKTCKPYITAINDGSAIWDIYVRSTITCSDDMTSSYTDPDLTHAVTLVQQTPRPQTITRRDDMIASPIGPFATPVTVLLPEAQAPQTTSAHHDSKSYTLLKGTHVASLLAPPIGPLTITIRDDREEGYIPIPSSLDVGPGPVIVTATATAGLPTVNPYGDGHTFGDDVSRRAVTVYDPTVMTTITPTVSKSRATPPPYTGSDEYCPYYGCWAEKYCMKEEDCGPKGRCLGHRCQYGQHPSATPSTLWSIPTMTITGKEGGETGGK